MIPNFYVLWWKFAKFLKLFSKPQFSFFSSFASLSSVMKDNSSVLFFKHYILFTEGTNQSVNFWDFWVLGSKFTKFLSVLKQQISFSSNFASMFSVMRHNSSVIFSWIFIYFQQKVPIKVQIWWNWKSKIWHFDGPFYQNNIKFQLKKYRRVISLDTVERCEV